MNYEQTPLPPSPALLTRKDIKTARAIREKLAANHFARTAQKCFKVPIKNRRHVLNADEFEHKPTQSVVKKLKVDQNAVCDLYNLPHSRRPNDEFLAKYGPYRIEKCTEGELDKKYEVYNRTVGDTIRSLKEQNAHIGKITDFRKFLRNKAEGDRLPAIEAKYAYGLDIDHGVADLEDIETIPVRKFEYPRFEVSKKDSLTWLTRAMRGQLPSRPIEKQSYRISEGDDLSKVLIKQETLDFNRERGTKKYRGKVIQPKVNSWLTQQEYEALCKRYEDDCCWFTGHGKYECRIKLLFPHRNADWTLQKKLYQGREKGHNAVFSSKPSTISKKNFGYDNDLYWPLNEKGYITPGTIDTSRNRGVN